MQTMRSVAWAFVTGVVVIAMLLVPAPTQAGDDSPGALAKEIETLQAELDAQLDHAENLAALGKTQEALDLLEKIEAEMAPRLRALRRRLRGEVPAPTPPEAARPLDLPGIDKRAVVDALDWLAAHQSPSGAWEAAGFNVWCKGQPVVRAEKRPDGLGKALYDVGVTGLALSTFLEAGYTHQGRHPYATTVRAGLRYLVGQQTAEGCFGPVRTQQYVYNHAAAALAMVQAYGLTGAPIFRAPAQKGLDYIDVARNPYFAWRYGVKPGDNDTSVSCWMIAVIGAAERFNRERLKVGERLQLPANAYDGMHAWLEKVTDPDYGRVGYVQRGTGSARPQGLVDRFPGDKTEAMTAAAIWCRMVIGEDPRRSKMIKLGADLLAKLPPTWNKADGSIDHYYWYYGTLAMEGVGAKHWAFWKKALQRSVVETQRQDTDACEYKGSWDPVGPWGLDGGRIYSTALLARCLIHYYGYDVLAPR